LLLRKRVKRMKWKSKKGFVLPEVMLAAAIAAFAVCGILLMYVTAMDLIRTSKNASIATNYAQRVMEQVRNTSFKDIPDMIIIENGTNYLPVVINPVITRWNFPLPVVILPVSNCLVQVDFSNPELLLVTISVSWRQSNRTVDSTMELVTQVAERNT